MSFLVYVSRFNDDRWIDIILKEAEKKIYKIKLNNFQVHGLTIMLILT